MVGILEQNKSLILLKKTKNRIVFMEKYNIEDIIFTIPDNLCEMRSIFSQMLDSDSLCEVNFANPEFLQTAMKNSILKKHMEKATFNFCDGIGLLMLINKEMRTNFGVESRYPGTDFFEYLPKEKEIRVFLYGANTENNNNATILIPKKYSNITICGHLDGYSNLSDEEILEKINLSQPDIVIVCLGCPNQEKWIEKNKEKLQTKFVFGNGGAIDFWSGNVKRAPAFFIKCKLEWLYRLFQDFNMKRIRRQSKIITFLWEMKIHKYSVRKL